MGRKLTRSRNKIIAGVAAGIAEYFELDPTIIRLGFVILCFMGFGVFVYLIGMIVMPKQESYVPKNFFDKEEDEFMGMNDKDRDFSKVMGDSFERTPTVSNSQILIGGGLILLGAFFLLQQFLNMRYFFPAMLILIGGMIIFRRRK